jgi:hypothetical protein
MQYTSAVAISNHRQRRPHSGFLGLPIFAASSSAASRRACTKDTATQSTSEQVEEWREGGGRVSAYLLDMQPPFVHVLGVVLEEVFNVFLVLLPLLLS